MKSNILYQQILLDWLSNQPQQKASYQTIRSAYENYSSCIQDSQPKFESIFFPLFETGIIECDDQNHYFLLPSQSLSLTDGRTISSWLGGSFKFSIDTDSSTTVKNSTPLGNLQRLPKIIDVMSQFEIFDDEYYSLQYRFDEKTNKLKPYSYSDSIKNGLYKQKDVHYSPFIVVYGSKMYLLPLSDNFYHLFQQCYALVTASVGIPMFKYSNSKMQLYQQRPNVPILLTRFLLLFDPEIFLSDVCYSSGFRVFNRVPVEVIEELQRIIHPRSVEVIYD